MFFVHVPGRNLDIGPRGVWAGMLANSGDPRVTRPRDSASRPQTADRRPPDRRRAEQHRAASRGKRSAGRLEMSRRVGGAESRCQAQSVGHAPARLAGWGPVRSSIFVEKNRRWSIFENLPMFPAQEPAGGGRSFHRCSDRGRSLGHCVLLVFLVSGAQATGLWHPCRATRACDGGAGVDGVSIDNNVFFFEVN